MSLSKVMLAKKPGVEPQKNQICSFSLKDKAVGEKVKQITIVDKAGKKKQQTVSVISQQYLQQSRMLKGNLRIRSGSPGNRNNVDKLIN